MSKISRRNYHVKPIEKPIAKELIIRNHYSHKWTACRYALGLFDGDETLCGVAVYGFPIGRRTIASIAPESDLTKDEVLELTRLWLRDEEPKNAESCFLSKTFKWLRVNTGIRILISYSDPDAGHIGTIYQASGWMYQGNSLRKVDSFYHVVHGEKLHPRSCVAKYGTTDRKKLTAIDPQYERIKIAHKHRYIFFLRDRKKLIRHLKHPLLPFPKRNENV